MVVLQVTLSVLGKIFNVLLEASVEVAMKKNLYKSIEDHTHLSNITKVNFLSNLREHHFKCFQKFAMKFIFIWPSFGQSQTPPHHFNKIGGSDTTWNTLQTLYRVKSGPKLPYQTMHFSEILRLTLLKEAEMVLFMQLQAFVM